MPQSKKVFANLFSRTRVEGQNKLRCVIEYVLLTGAARSGKVYADIGPIRNEAGFTDDLKDALTAHLNATYAPESFTPGDIVGLSI